MLKSLLISSAILFVSVAPAFADPTTIANAHSARFDKAFAACDVPAVLDLYEEDAVAIYPGEGEVANGKSEIEKLVKRYCSDGKIPPYKQTSAHARAIGRDYIIMVRMLDGVDANGKPVRFRATELIHKSAGQWRYLVDHASVGLPPPAPSKPPTKSAP